MIMDHRLREVVDAFVARVRRDLDAHVQGLTSDLLRIGTENQEYWRSTLERAVTDARQDAERGFKARLEALRNELTREMDVRLSSERTQLQAATNAAELATRAAAEAAQIAQAQAAQANAAQAQATLAEMSRTSDGGSARTARVDTLERLLGAVRRIDESESLIGILQSLADGAAAQTSRVALMMLDGDVLTPWLSHGFSAAHGPRATDVGTSGLLTATVALRQTSYVKPMIARELTTPGFMQVPVGHTGLVVPLVVGGEVVAVLYADDVGAPKEQEDAPVWTEEIDLLVRHASLRLENLTSVRTTEALSS